MSGVNRASKKSVLRRLKALALVEWMETRRMMSTTYYVSPTGSDTNAGTSQAAPWQTVAKVNATSFLPGDSILFQYGSQFRASLTASSSGTQEDPITYGAYGDSTLSNPLFIGSDILDTSQFTLVTGTTYSMASTTPINWVYDNHEFMRETTDALTIAGSSQAADPATNISYVESNTNFFYYDAATTTLYVNRGGSFAEQLITASTRQDAVYSLAQSNLIFTNLDVTETADDNAGYGVRVQSSTNVQVLNSTASLTGKHAFGVIDSTGFVGKNLVADQSNPDLGFGGASAFVSFSDSSQTGNTSQWIDCTYTNPGGPYPVFVSHGDTGSIASILLQNIVSLNGYGTGMSIQSTDNAERITILGGELQGGALGLSADDSIVDGMRFDQGNAGVQIDGSGNVVQNCVFTNLSVNIDAGNDGGFVDMGTDNVCRFNTFYLQTGPAVFIGNANASSSVYANVFDCKYPILLISDTAGEITSSDNVFSAPDDPSFILGGTLDTTFIPFAQWQTLGYDTNSILVDPGLVDPADGNFQLSDSSPAIDLYKSTPDSSIVAVTDDFAGNPRPVGAGYDAGAYEAQIPITGSVSVSGGTLAAPLPGTTAPAIFTVTLSSAQTTPTTVQYATVDSTAIAGTDYTATSGTLTIPAGVTSQTITVPVNAALAANSSKAFQLTLTGASAGITLVTASATATVSNANETTVAFNKKSPAIYTDSSGKKVTMKIGGLGTGTALFVAGNADPVQIELTGTTAASSFSVTTIGGVTTIEDVIVQGSIGSITTTASLTGSLDVTGTVARLTLGNVAAAISLESAADHPTLKFGAVTDGTLTSASTITSLSAANWTGSITGTAIGTLAVKGAFAGNVTLSSGGVALNSVKVGGITSGTWAITGLTATISAASITNLTAAFTGGIKTLKVTGAVTGSSVRAAANIGTISVGAAMNSTFFAGVNATLTTLPTATTDFTGADQITSFVVTAPRTFANAFTNSFVAAAKIVTVKVQRVTTANSGTAFGIAAENLGAFTDVETGKKTFSWNSHKSTSLLTFAGDFKVSVI